MYFMPIHRFRRRGAALVTGALATAVALSGCASPNPVPRTVFPSQTAPPLMAAPLTPVPTFTGYAPPLNAISTTLRWPQPSPVMHFPMPWIDFAVVITNSSTFSFKQIEPVVVLGLCTCNPARHDLRPHEALQVWDATSKVWRMMTSAIMKPDGSYSYAQQIPPIDLGPQASTVINYRLMMSSTAKQTGMVDGNGSVAIYVVQTPGHERLVTKSEADAAQLLVYKVN
jgi:hypothetical protein